jgi:hypothetical protein
LRFGIKTRVALAAISLLFLYPLLKTVTRRRPGEYCHDIQSAIDGRNLCEIDLYVAIILRNAQLVYPDIIVLERQLGQPLQKLRDIPFLPKIQEQ